jgi:hypothetical protein
MSKGLRVCHEVKEMMSESVLGRRWDWLLKSRFYFHHSCTWLGVGIASSRNAAIPNLCHMSVRLEEWDSTTTINDNRADPRL